MQDYFEEMFIRQLANGNRGIWVRKYICDLSAHITISLLTTVMEESVENYTITPNLV